MTSNMPKWLANWLGVPPSSAADSAAWQLDSAWSWPPWATLLLLLAVVSFTAFLYARESSSAGRAYRVLLTRARQGMVIVVFPGRGA